MTTDAIGPSFPDGGSAEELLSLLGQQRDLYAQLAGLAGGQRALIAGDRPEQLLAVLSERQRLIGRIEQVARRLGPYKADWAGVRAALDERQGPQAEQLLAEADGLLAAVLEKDEADARLLARRKEATARAAGAARAAQQVGAAYGAQMGSQGSGTEWTE